MTKSIRFFVIKGKEPKSITERTIEIDPQDRMIDVKDKVMKAFGKKDSDTFGKVYLQQNIEVRDLDCEQYKEKRFLSIGAFEITEPIEVHFERVPILFLLFSNDKKTHRRVLHVNPNQKIQDLEDMVKDRFGIRDEIEIDLVHQGFLMLKDKRLKDFINFDPAHSIVIIPRIFKDEPSRLPLN
ncbi:MAG: hypothetical protein ACTSXU_14195 [Promethearchaeota archaeon]